MGMPHLSGETDVNPLETPTNCWCHERRYTLCMPAKWCPGFLAIVAIGAAAVACSRSQHGAAPITPPPATATARPAIATCDEQHAVEFVRPSVVRVSTANRIGTGIITGPNTIVTNAHVVGEARTVSIVTMDGKGQGTVIGSSPNIDIATISADTGSLPPIEWGSSTFEKPGDRLYALGFALDLPGEPSLNAGSFVTWRSRNGVDYVQSDVPLNPGSSGGPLFTDCGKVISVNTLSNGAGISLSIQSELAKATAANTIEDVARPATEGVSDAIAPVPVTELTPAPEVCGQRAAVSLAEPLALGRTYHDGDTLSASLNFVVPGCTGVKAEFNGYFGPGTPWFEHWCSPPLVPTCKRVLPGFVKGGDTPLAATARITITAQPGSFPPSNLRDPANLEGFTLCQLHLTFHDSKIGGRYYDYFLGNWESSVGTC